MAVGWIVSVTVPPDEVDVTSGALWSAGVLGIEERRVEGAELVELRAGIGSDHDRAAVVAVVAGDHPVTVEPVADESWLDTWQEHATVEEVGERLEVHPTWLPASPAGGSGRLVVAMPPHRAFGSGGHPTTRLALEEIERSVPPARSVLDVGCGSGLLASAAALLGASRVVALDIDHAARAATVATANANGVADHVEVSSAHPSELGERFDLVVANILVEVLEDLLPSMVDCLQPDGRLVLSGLLDAQSDRMASACGKVGCHVLRREDRDGWGLLVTGSRDLGP